MEGAAKRWWIWVQSEGLLVIAVLGLGVTSAFLRRVPTYTSADAEVIFLLWALFVTTRGLQRHHLLAHLAARLERGGHMALKLTFVTFGLSMLVTNDVALISVVPLTMLLHTPARAWMVVLEALAANAGSALSPFGNPQNLFLYWFYEIPAGDFVRVMLPFAGVFLALLTVGAWAVDRRYGVSDVSAPVRLPQVGKGAYFYLGWLFLLVAAVLRWLPLWVGLGPILYAAWKDRGTLRVDYALLATFGAFFGLTDNLQVILATVLAHPHHVFLLAAILSQGLSNVPTALLLADFTTRWPALLWGVSVGGFGTLWASLANLIAYRAYAQAAPQGRRLFLLRFHLLSLAALSAGVALYGWLFVWR